MDLITCDSGCETISSQFSDTSDGIIGPDGPMGPFEELERLAEAGRVAIPETYMPADMEICDEQGRGGQAVVHTVMLKQTNTHKGAEVALKSFTGPDKQAHRCLEREVTSMLLAHSTTAPPFAHTPNNLPPHLLRPPIVGILGFAAGPIPTDIAELSSGAGSAATTGADCTAPSASATTSATSTADSDDAGSDEEDIVRGFIMEKYDLSLRDFIEGIGGVMDQVEALSVLLNVTCAVAVLHAKDVLHMDIKSDNVLINMNDRGNIAVPDFIGNQTAQHTAPQHNVALADFGLAMLPWHPRGHMGRLATPFARAPELAASDLEHDRTDCAGMPRECVLQLSQAVDVFALGVIAFETFETPPLLSLGSEQEILQRIVAGTAFSLGDGGFVPLRDDRVMSALWLWATAPQAEDRPTAAKLFRVICDILADLVIHTGTLRAAEEGTDGRRGRMCWEEGGGVLACAEVLKLGKATRVRHLGTAADAVVAAAVLLRPGELLAHAACGVLSTGDAVPSPHAFAGQLDAEVIARLDKITRGVDCEGGVASVLRLPSLDKTEGAEHSMLCLPPIVFVAEVTEVTRAEVTAAEGASAEVAGGGAARKVPLGTSPHTAARHSEAFNPTDEPTLAVGEDCVTAEALSAVAHVPVAHLAVVPEISPMGSIKRATGEVLELKGSAGSGLRQMSVPPVAIMPLSAPSIAREGRLTTAYKARFERRMSTTDSVREEPVLELLESVSSLEEDCIPLLSPHAPRSHSFRFAFKPPLLAHTPPIGAPPPTLSLLLRVSRNATGVEEPVVARGALDSATSASDLASLASADSGMLIPSFPGCLPPDTRCAGVDGEAQRSVAYISGFGGDYSAQQWELPGEGRDLLINDTVGVKGFGATGSGASWGRVERGDAEQRCKAFGRKLLRGMQRVVGRGKGVKLERLRQGSCPSEARLKVMPGDKFKTNGLVAVERLSATSSSTEGRHQLGQGLLRKLRAAFRSPAQEYGQCPNGRSFAGENPFCNKP